MTKFQEILLEFTQLGIEFVIIGGVAARIHGSSYATDDLHVCYERSKKNLQKISDWLQRHHASLRGAPANLPFVPDVNTFHAGLNFTFLTDVGSIDFIGEVQPVGFYPTVLQHSLSLEVFGIQCRIIDIDTLIQIKKIISRPKDLAVALELEAIKELQRDKKSK